MRSSCRRRRRTDFCGGLTLLEVMVTMAVLMLIFVTVAEVVDRISAAWRGGATDPFAASQAAFDVIAGDLSRATLAPYQDYADSSGAFRTSPAFVPDHLARRSDLAFTCGPATGMSGLAPVTGRTVIGSAVFFAATDGIAAGSANAGLGQLLNARGYFVEFGDRDAPAFFSLFNHQYRWRLKQVSQSSEGLQVYAASTTSAAWIQGLTAAAVTSVLAENVIALVVLPERNAGDNGAALAPAFAYDSRDGSNGTTLHQLPPRVRVVLVAIDAGAAAHLAALHGASAPPLVSTGLFQKAAALDADVSTLDASLLAQKINHRIYQRDIQLLSSAWAGTAAP